MPTIFNINAATQVQPITTAQRGTIPAATLSTGGSIIYNSDTAQFQFWQNSAWLSIPALGIGSVNGPVSTTVGHIATWNNTTGTLLADGAASISVVSSINQLNGIGKVDFQSGVGTFFTAGQVPVTFSVANLAGYKQGCSVFSGGATAFPTSVYAQLELQTTVGALLLSRMTSTQIAAITPVNGMIAYNSTTGRTVHYDGGSWVTPYAPGLPTYIYDDYATFQNNLFVGTGIASGLVIGTAGQNVGIGADALNSLAEGSSNTGVGTGALYSITDTGSNTAVGDNAGYLIVYGNGNTCVGASSGPSELENVAGQYNTYIGTNAGSTAGGGPFDYSTAIGYGAKIGASYSVILGGISPLGVSTNVGIGLSNPSYPLHIAGTRTIEQTMRLTGIQNFSSTNITGFLNDIVLTTTSASNTVVHQWIYPNFNATGGTITIGAGLLIAGGGNSGGTITNGYGLYVSNPGFGSTKCAIYGDNASIGYTGVTPPTNSLIVSGNIGTGLSNPSYPLHMAGSRTGIRTLYITGTQSSNNSIMAALQIDATLTSTGAVGTAMHSYINPIFNATGGTISNAAAFLVDGGTNGGGTITNGYGLFVNNPGFGTNKCAIYSENASIGYTGVTPPTNSLVVSGRIGIGLSNPSYPFHISGTRSTKSMVVTSIQNGGGTDNIGFLNDIVLTSTSATTTALHQWIYPNFNATGGTITVAAGLLIDGGGNSGGTITNGYGLYVANPTFGSTKCAIYGVNASIGYTNVTPPTNSLIISGKLGVGTNNPASTSHVVSATGSRADYGMCTIDSATSGGSGLTFGYDSGNSRSWIYSRTNGVTGRALDLNNEIFIGWAANGISFGTSTLTSSRLVTAYDILPSSNKGKDIGSSTFRFNNVYYSSATTGTSRLAESRTHCYLCDMTMMRGTGTTIILGEEADYIPVFCLDCGDQKMEAVKHLPSESLSKRKAPTKIQFLGFKVCQYSGNSRGIQVLFKYDDDKENSTFLSDVEHDAFLLMDMNARKKYLEELGLREWNALEEVRLMEQECGSLQSKLDVLVKEFVNKDIYTKDIAVLI